MQAIVTKFIGPTNHRGARIIATCEAGKLAVSWDYALSVEPNHHVAAVMLAQKLGWKVETRGQLVSGAMPGAGYCHVFVKAPDVQMKEFPYGECECRQGCQCEFHPGPAAESIERDGKPMKVCTRCTLTGDEKLGFLVKPGDDLSVFERYDFLGAFCIATAARPSEDVAK